MDIGEEGDKLRDGVVGIDLMEQPALMNPSEATVLRRYLYPYTVLGVGGKDADIGHDKVLPFIDSKGVNRKSGYDLLWLLAGKKEMLATGDEVETHMVMVSINEIE